MSPTESPIEWSIEPANDRFTDLLEVLLHVRIALFMFQVGESDSVQPNSNLLSLPLGRTKLLSYTYGRFGQV